VSERRLLAAAGRLARRAEAQLGDLGPGPDPRAIAAAAIEALEDRPDDAAELHDLALAALDLEEELRRGAVARDDRRRSELARALARLREIETSAELVERLCEEAARGCGLGRVVLGRVRDGVWSPWKIHDADEQPAAHPDRLPRTAIAVDDMPSAAAGSFAVASIEASGVVLGLLHGDRPIERREVGDSDRALLSALAAGAGRIYERLVERERFEAQLAVMGDARRATDAIMSGDGGDIELVQLVGRSHAPGPAGDDVPAVARRMAFDEELTKRERDVLALMVRGKGNDAIAEALAVTRSTVKSHVRSVLRKIGAVNRAEAISRYHAMR
jgi:DNA-binding CsgD family transcriptional regulator